jgi:hypothetical protein
VEMQMRSTHTGRSGYAFLNSEASYKSASNLAVAIPPAALKEIGTPRTTRPGPWWAPPSASRAKSKSTRAPTRSGAPDSGQAE